MLLKEMQEEAATTRKMLQLVPDDKLSWKAHPKSMDLERLTAHIAELPGWVSMALNTSELDFANNPYEPKPINNNKDLMQYFEDVLAEGRARLETATEEELKLPWILRNGDRILADRTKAEVIRMSYSQIVHHRAQLGVYLRLLNIPIPGSYGPSADELGL